jgi:hypothetical protein
MTIEAVDHPKHYNAHPSGIEAVEACEHLSFNLGNALKYLWRVGLKGDAVEDLRKAEWYLTREAQRLRQRPGGSFELSMGSREWHAPAKLAALHDAGVLGDVLRILLDFARGDVLIDNVPVDALLRVQKEIEAHR